MGREDRIYEEVSALWRELYGEAPPQHVDGSQMIDQIMGGLPDKTYDRLRSPYLRPASITGPAATR